MGGCMVGVSICAVYLCALMSCVHKVCVLSAQGVCAVCTICEFMAAKLHQGVMRERPGAPKSTQAPELSTSHLGRP